MLTDWFSFLRLHKKIYEHIIIVENLKITKAHAV